MSDLRFDWLRKYGQMQSIHLLANRRDRRRSSMSLGANGRGGSQLYGHSRVSFEEAVAREGGEYHGLSF